MAVVEYLDAMGRQIPTIGRVVVFHHAEDAADYPAIISLVEVTVGAEGTPSSYRCQLTVFRPRAIFWPWAYEGVQFGCWSWPKITRPEPDVMGS